MDKRTREGYLYGLAAYGWWGLVPIYFHWLGKISPFDILAHRIVWSAGLLALILTLARRWTEVTRCLTTSTIVAPLIVSALLVAGNWFLYILSVYYGIIVQSSLGYFILPLVSVGLGLVIFRERLRPLQWLAILFAATGVLWLTWEAGVLPWLALGLAISFSIYGMIRKQVPVDGLIGLAVETIVLAPIAVGYLILHYAQEMEFEDPLLMFKLSLSGVVTTVPLLCFGQAARRLPFATLGFLQYISPSLQFVLAITIFHEAVLGGWFSFGLIWIALAIFSLDSVRAFRMQALSIPSPHATKEPAR